MLVHKLLQVSMDLPSHREPVGSSCTPPCSAWIDISKHFTTLLTVLRWICQSSASSRESIGACLHVIDALYPVNASKLLCLRRKHCCDIFRQIRTIWLREEFFQPRGPVGKDFLYVWSDEKFLDKPAAKDSVVHLISYQCAVGDGNKGMCMNPAAVGTTTLLINEGVRWIPSCYLALPTDRNTTQFQTIVN